MFMQPFRPRPTRRLVTAAWSAILICSLCSCQTTDLSDVTGSLGDKAEMSRETSHAPAPTRHDLDAYRDRYRANPKDTEAALAYGKALRAAGQRTQAVAVLEQASLADPSNKTVLAVYGRALIDNGNFQEAFDILGRAHTPDDPDWRILSAQGSALDQLGRYEEARQYYTSALAIAPDEPAVLSNLGLSYVLSKDLAKAEEILHRASNRPDANPRVRQNLALVVGLRGRTAEAETIAKGGRSAEEAAADIAALKRMLRKEAARAEAPRPN